MKTINSFKGEYGFLSNFYPSMLVFQGWHYPTVEHAFQAFKMTTTEDHHIVRSALTPGIAKRIARSRPKKDDWDQVRDMCMLCCLRYKFGTHLELRDKLLATGDAILVEGNTWGDVYWGVCKGKGENKLGQLLMQVRQELRDAQIA